MNLPEEFAADARAMALLRALLADYPLAEGQVCQLIRGAVALGALAGVVQSQRIINETFAQHDAEAAAKKAAT